MGPSASPTAGRSWYETCTATGTCLGKDSCRCDEKKSFELPKHSRLSTRVRAPERRTPLCLFFPETTGRVGVSRTRALVAALARGWSPQMGVRGQPKLLGHDAARLARATSVRTHDLRRPCVTLSASRALIVARSRGSTIGEAPSPPLDPPHAGMLARVAGIALPATRCYTQPRPA